MKNLENEFKERLKRIEEKNSILEKSEAFSQKKGISKESIDRNIEKKTKK